MKTRFLIILFVFVQGNFCVSQERGFKTIQLPINGQYTTLYQQSHALLIGVSNYDNGLTPLPGVAEDIKLVKAALEENGFDIEVVMNPTSVALQKAFSRFISQYGQGADNRLLFYYAGHGYTEKMPYGDDIGYICPIDTPDPNKNSGEFQGKAMAMGQIEIYAKQIKSKHAIFIFDACFAGQIFSTSRAIPEIISYKTKEPVRQFITSGSATETVPDKSVFCTQFIRGLKGEADGNKDGFVTGTEFGEFLQASVVNYSYGSQHPQFGKIRNPNLDKGDFVFVTSGSAETVEAPPTIRPPEPKKIVVEEAPVTGTLEISTEISGSLYLDDVLLRSVEASNRYTIKELKPGEHTLKISGSEPWEEKIMVTPEATVKVGAKKKARTEAIEMILVSRGTFTMGSNDEDDEKPSHSVSLSDYYIGKYEVSQKLWRDIMGSDPVDLKFKGCDLCPVEGVSWNDVQNFIQKLNKKTGLNYRLPTEAEWEYAARGGNQSKGYLYSGGMNPGDVAWCSENSDRKTQAVGQKKPNELGLFDMSGNISEWCSDWYDKKYYKTSPNSDPAGPATGVYRIHRGGSWFNAQLNSRCAARTFLFPGSRYFTVGFRLARSK